MKEKIISIIALLSIVILIISVIFGINFGKLKISSISQLKDENQNVIEKLDETQDVVTNKYPMAIKKLEDNYTEYSNQRNRYFEISGMSEYATSTFETKQYDITYLWKKIGSYATDRDLAIGISVKRNASSLYDINFTIKGDYTDVSDFIVDIEDDSELNFRIYNFNMVADSKNVNILIANFTCKNINIDSSTINSSESTSEPELSENSSEKTSASTTSVNSVFGR